MIVSEALCYIVAALLLLIFPIPWIISAATAAIVHEIFHILAVIVMGGKIKKIRVHLSGCQIETTPMGEIRSIICILAGPLGSLMLIGVRKYVPMISVCGLLQGIYNLLPVMPLDGGRILRIILQKFSPIHADSVMRWTSMAVGVTILILGTILSCCLHIQILPIICGILFNIRIQQRKIPCKENRIGLQWY